MQLFPFITIFSPDLHLLYYVIQMRLNLTSVCIWRRPYVVTHSFLSKSYTVAAEQWSVLGVCSLPHPSCYKRWRATLIALMSSTVCSQPSHNEICSRRNRPERLGRTLRHMAETAVISMAGGWMLQIGKRLSHPELRPRWRGLQEESPTSTNVIFSLLFQRAGSVLHVCLRAFMSPDDPAEEAELYVVICFFPHLWEKQSTLLWVYNDTCGPRWLFFYEERGSNTV